MRQSAEEGVPASGTGRSKSTMLEKMKEILAEQLGCEADMITEETSFKDDLGADSLDLLEVIMALEDEYGVEMNAEDLSDLNTVGDVMSYLKENGIEI